MQAQTLQPTLVCALLELLVVCSLLDNIEDVGGQGTVGEWVRLGVHIIVSLVGYKSRTTWDEMAKDTGKD